MDRYKIYPKQFRNEHIPIEKNSCFFIMPFASEFDIVYGTIKDGLSEEYLCKRVDESKLSTPILNKILVEILKSQFIIVDLSGSNPNVFYELGIAHTFKDAQNIFLIKNKKSKVPFDIAQLSYIEYDIDNLKYMVVQLKKAIAENRFFSDLNEALNVHGITKLNHENQTFSLEVIYSILDDYLALAVDILNSNNEIKETEVDHFLDWLHKRVRFKIQELEQNDLKITLNLYFEILICSYKYCNIEMYLTNILSDFFSMSNLSDSEITAFQTDCALKFANNKVQLNIVMPWIISYFKKSKFANIDLNRYRLESFLLTTNFTEVNRMICCAVCDKDSHIREHFANIIGEKRLTEATDILATQLNGEKNYYTAASIIEALGELKAVNKISSILQWIEDNKEEILATKNYFVLRHTYISLSKLDSQIAKEFNKVFSEYII